MDFTSFNNYPIDFIVLSLVLLAGLFQKKYLFNVNINAAWKTLLVSAVFTLVYAALVKIGGSFTKDLPVKWFFSYVTGTSLYELLLKKVFNKFFPDDAGSLLKIIVVVALLLPGTSCTMKEAATTQHAALAVDNAGISSQPSLTTQTAESVWKIDLIEYIRNYAAVAFLCVFAAIVLLAWGIIYMDKNNTLLKEKLSHE